MQNTQTDKSLGEEALSPASSEGEDLKLGEQNQEIKVERSLDFEAEKENSIHLRKTSDCEIDLGDWEEEEDESDWLRTKNYGVK